VRIAKQLLMTTAYKLAIADRMYSSWSLRGWLSFVRFDIPVKVQHYQMFTPSFATMQEEFAPARQVPAVKLDYETICWDSLAIVEELNERHANASFWPKDPSARAFCRSMVAEMHSGFSALRSQCPMNLRYVYQDFVPSAEVLEDCQRIELLWTMAKAKYGNDAGPWLFGQQYTAADVFFAPVATRFTTYSTLPRSDASQAYIDAHVSDVHFRQWRAMATASFQVIGRSEFPELTTVPWPVLGNTTVATKSDAKLSVNPSCPYSGKVVTHALALADGTVYGFCNEFCRDKTLADPDAWPQFMELVRSHHHGKA
jgi:glutathione S-transferase